MFEKINRWYQQHLWTKEMVGEAVEKGKISAEEYQQITGEEYSNN